MPEASRLVSRYISIETVGEGGMGTVMRAYDPKLRREVALKRLHSRSLDRNSAARLVREAQALAQLSHPNVVAVYDVEAENEDVLVAMEFVRGDNLAHWLRGERTWQQKVEVMIKAGRGLAAAHAANLVHRDFKPGNVMVSDSGEVKVTDFGLAKVGSGRGLDDSEAFASQHPSIDPDIAEASETPTRGDVLLGTPPYMAPEQHAGTTSTPATDQYAFCLSLWQALVGKRPFRGNIRTLHRAKLDGPPKWPRDVHVPARLVEAIRRGMAPTPADRWPSMGPLLEALERCVQRRRTHVPALATAAVLGAGLTSVVWMQAGSDSPCDGAQAQLDAVWDASTRDALRAAMERAAPLSGSVGWARVSSRLDAYGARWAAGYQDACEATAVRGDQSPAVMDLRMACLNRAKQSMAARVQRLLEVDPRSVSRAVDVVDALPDLDRCADVDALSNDAPLPAQERDRVALADARAGLADAVALHRLGRYAEGLETVRHVREVFDAQGLEPRRVDVELLAQEGLGLEAAGRYEDAEATLREAVALAVGLGTPREAIVALNDWSFVLEARLHRAEEAQQSAELALALAIRRDEPVLIAESIGRLANVLDARAQYDAAEARFHEAIGILEKPGVDEPLALSGNLNELGSFLWSRGRSDEALPVLLRALELRERVLGPQHPYVGSTLANLGNAYVALGKRDEAETALVRALDIFEQVHGAEHPRTSTVKGNLAALLTEAGQLDRAVSLLEEVRRSRVAMYGLAHPKTAEVYNNLGALEHHRENPAKAFELIGKAAEIWEAALGPEHPQLRQVNYNLGLLAYELGKYDEAVQHHRRALEIDPEAPPEVLARSRFELGRALWRVDGKHDEALEHTRAARDMFEAAGDTKAVEEADAWLAERLD